MQPEKKEFTKTLKIITYAVPLSLLYIIGKEVDPLSTTAYFFAFIVPSAVLGTLILRIVIEEAVTLYHYYNKQAK